MKETWLLEVVVVVVVVVVIVVVVYLFAIVAITIVRERDIFPYPNTTNISLIIFSLQFTWKIEEQILFNKICRWIKKMIITVILNFCFK